MIQRDSYRLLLGHLMSGTPAMFARTNFHPKGRCCLIRGQSTANGWSNDIIPTDMEYAKFAKHSSTHMLASYAILQIVAGHGAGQ